jgi:hypothetical protein
MKRGKFWFSQESIGKGLIDPFDIDPGHGSQVELHPGCIL